MARMEALEFAALLEAIEAERRNQALRQVPGKQRSHSAVGRVLAMAHQLGRDSAHLTDRSAVRAALN